jgi:hypothetical protein
MWDIVLWQVDEHFLQGISVLERDAEKKEYYQSIFEEIARHFTNGVEYLCVYSGFGMAMIGGSRHECLAIQDIIHNEGFGVMDEQPTGHSPPPPPFLRKQLALSN